MLSSGLHVVNNLVEAPCNEKGDVTFGNETAGRRQQRTIATGFTRIVHAYLEPLQKR